MKSLLRVALVMSLPVLAAAQSMSVTLTPGEYGGYTCFPEMPGCPSSALSCVTPEQGTNPLLLVPSEAGCKRTWSVNGNVASWTDDCGTAGKGSSGSMTVTKNPDTYNISTSVGIMGYATLDLSYLGPTCTPSVAATKPVAMFGAPMKATVASVDAAAGTATFRNEHGVTVTTRVANAVTPGASVELRRKRNSKDTHCVQVSIAPCAKKDCGIGLDLVTMSCPGQPNTTSCEPNPRCAIDLIAQFKADTETLESPDEANFCQCHADYDRSRKICPFLPGISGWECWTKAQERLKDCLEKAKKAAGVQ